MGVKISNCLYSEKDNYCRFDLEATELFFRKELVRSERIKLMNNNVYQLINYHRIINDDDDYFLWMKLANDKNNFICFNNQNTRMEWFDLIKQNTKNSPIFILIGTKADQIEENGSESIGEEHIKEFREKHNLSSNIFFKTSSLTGQNIKDVFTEMSNLLYQKVSK